MDASATSLEILDARRCSRLLSSTHDQQEIFIRSSNDDPDCCYPRSSAFSLYTTCKDRSYLKNKRCFFSQGIWTRVRACHWILWTSLYLIRFVSDKLIFVEAGMRLMKCFSCACPRASYSNIIIYHCVLRSNMSAEPLLEPDTTYSLLPMDPKWKQVWAMYKQAWANVWTFEEIDLSTDSLDYETKLSDAQRHFLNMWMAFFAVGDSLVNENLECNFLAEVGPLPVKFFYSFQDAMENIHAETYSGLIEGIVRDPAVKNKLFNAITELPLITKKKDYMKRWMDRRHASFAERLIAFACVEGIFFSGGFCAIFYFRKQGLMPGLTFANEKISQDEALHRDFACLLYRDHIVNKPSKERVLEIVKEAVDLETEFVTDTVPVSMIGMNCELMAEYIKFVADHLLVTLGYDRLYGVSNPFPWMDLISMQSKANFFESRVSQYKRAAHDPRSKIESFEAEF